MAFPRIKDLSEMMVKLVSGNKAERALPNQTDSISDDVLANLIDLGYNDIARLLNGIKSNDLKDKDWLQVLDAMSKDSLISAAVDMVVADATQQDPNNNHVIWVDAKVSELYDSEESKEGNNLDEASRKTVKSMLREVNEWLITKINIDELLPVIARQVYIYGEAYLKTYYSEYDTEMVKGRYARNEPLIDSFGYRSIELQCPDYQVKELIEYNNTVGYFKTDTREMFSPYDYIHFIHDKGERDVQEILYTPQPKDGKRYKDPMESEPIKRKFQIRKGSSFVESAREAFEVLQLLELILLISRFNRSIYYRIFQVDVGASTRSEISKMLYDIKKAINKSETINLPSGKYTSKQQPLPLGGNIFIPMKNGKGQISIDTISPDQNLRELLDVEYYQNKLFAALRIPKAFLGQDESSPQGVGNISLLVQDVRYARTVLELVSVLKNGITDLVDWYLIVTGQEKFIGKYQVKTTQLLTAMENTSLEAQMQKINYAQSLMSLFEQFGESVDSTKASKFICEEILHSPELWEKVSASSEALDLKNKIVSQELEVQMEELKARKDMAKQGVTDNSSISNTDQTIVKSPIDKGK